MNKTGIVVLSVIMSIGHAFADAEDPLTPPEVTPKQVAPRSGKIIIERRKERPPSGDKPLNPDQPNLTIQGIILVKDRSEVQEGGAAAVSGLEVKDVIYPLDNPDFKAMIETRFIGKPLNENNIRDLQEAIILYCRSHGKVLIDVILPEQVVEKGVLQVWVLEGSVSHVTVRNDGIKWFKDKFILDNVRLRSGQSVDTKELGADLNWLNNNPFRQVDAVFKPGEKLGLTDVELQVNDRIPVRPYVGYEDSGTRFTGPDRVLVGLNWGNAFWLDHQFNYQYSTDTDFDLVKAHSASYLAPLPWRHSLMIYGSYVDARAKLPQGTSADGHSWQTSLRYSIPLPQIQKYRNQFAAGLDFKRSNNSLLAGGVPIFAPSDTDIAQVVLEYTGLLPDPWGRTSFGIEAYYSPGELTSHNNSKDFDALRRRATAYYFYARFNAERVTRLPGNFSWVLRGWAQYTPEQRLLPSEELALGGYNTIRGYDERIILGDSGWVINNELRTPPIHLIDYFHLSIPRDELQFLAFFDYGGVRVNQIRPEDNTDAKGDPNRDLYSAGAGFRYAIGSNLSFRFDYGFPLTQKELNEHPNGRVHLGALVSF
jgi:hemolysin activation/secretion protein